MLIQIKNNTNSIPAVIFPGIWQLIQVNIGFGTIIRLTANPHLARNQAKGHGEEISAVFVGRNIICSRSFGKHFKTHTFPGLNAAFCRHRAAWKCNVFNKLRHGTRWHAVALQNLAVVCSAVCNRHIACLWGSEAGHTCRADSIFKIALFIHARCLNIARFGIPKVSERNRQIRIGTGFHHTQITFARKILCSGCSGKFLCFAVFIGQRTKHQAVLGRHKGQT